MDIQLYSPVQAVCRMIGESDLLGRLSLEEKRRQGADATKIARDRRVPIREIDELEYHR